MPPPTSSPMTPPATRPARKTWWQPAAGLTWQWDLSEERIDTSIQAEVYDIDLYAEQAVIEALHARGAKVICYISVGSWENWRPDRDQFPAEVLGRDYEGWPGEKWLDIRQIKKLAPILRARFDLCQQKGFDGIEPDNMEIYTNNTGFPITRNDQLQYALWLAEEAHARSLAIGQKNAPDMTPDLAGVYDFAISEDAYYYGWAKDMLPYAAANKAVFAAEYTDMDVDFPAACAWGREHKVSFILKQRNLDAWRQACP